jgi:UDP-GlcNAc:undecaprenyl-phosphate GlcNAc-1-phosphate transferase
MSLSREVVEAIPALVIGFLLACAVTMMVTPVVRAVARRLGMVDRPEARRVNTEAVARGGGVAVGIGFLAVSLIMLALNYSTGRRFVDEPAGVGLGQITALFGGAALAVALGLFDDVLQLRARWQLIGQVLLALVAFGLGIAVTKINLPIAPSGTWDIPGLVVGLATIIWIVGMINSINFIDGLDGLSTGIGLIAALTLGLISLGPGTNQPFVALFCFILAGALAGFLRWNFNPASIFPGTSGIMLVGYVLAVLSILGAAKVAVALLVLGIPIMDTFWIIVRRLVSRRSPFAPDRGHIHHRLLDLGLSQRATVLLIYGVCIVLAALSLGLSNTGATYTFLGLVIVFGLALLAIERLGGGAREIQEGLSASSYAAPQESRKAPAAATSPPTAPSVPASEPAPGHLDSL